MVVGGGCGGGGGGWSGEWGVGVEVVVVIQWHVFLSNSSPHYSMIPSSTHPLRNDVSGLPTFFSKCYLLLPKLAKQNFPRKQHRPMPDRGSPHIKSISTGSPDEPICPNLGSVPSFRARERSSIATGLGGLAKRVVR